MPALFIELPLTRRKKVLIGFSIRCLFKSIPISIWSSAGEGKPAEIVSFANGINNVEISSLEEGTISKFTDKVTGLV